MPALALTISQQSVGLKAPPGLQVGIVKKVRDAKGNLIKVCRKALHGRVVVIERLIRKLGIGTRINTSHIERLNGTLRTQQQGRMGRRSRNVSRLSRLLECALWLWRDLYNWHRVHGSLHGRTPAIALGLATEVWTINLLINPVLGYNSNFLRWAFVLFG